jgi:hypothetical protein
LLLAFNLHSYFIWLINILKKSNWLIERSGRIGYIKSNLVVKAKPKTKRFDFWRRVLKGMKEKMK